MYKRIFLRPVGWFFFFKNIYSPKICIKKKVTNRSINRGIILNVLFFKHSPIYRPIFVTFFNFFFKGRKGVLSLNKKKKKKKRGRTHVRPYPWKGLVMSKWCAGRPPSCGHGSKPRQYISQGLLVNWSVAGKEMELRVIATLRRTELDLLALMAWNLTLWRNERCYEYSFYNAA